MLINLKVAGWRINAVTVPAGCSWLLLLVIIVVFIIKYIYTCDKTLHWFRH